MEKLAPNHWVCSDPVLGTHNQSRTSKKKTRRKPSMKSAAQGQVNTGINIILGEFGTRPSGFRDEKERIKEQRGLRHSQELGLELRRVKGNP